MLDTTTAYLELWKQVCELLKSPLKKQIEQLNGEFNDYDKYLNMFIERINRFCRHFDVSDPDELNYRIVALSNEEFGILEDYIEISKNDLKKINSLNEEVRFEIEQIQKVNKSFDRHNPATLESFKRIKSYTEKLFYIDEQNLKQLQIIESKLNTLSIRSRLEKVESLVEESNFEKELYNRAEELKKSTEEISRKSNEATKALNIAQDATANKAISDSEEIFKNLIKEHKSYSQHWFTSFIIASICFILTVGYIYYFTTPATDITFRSVLLFGKNAMLLSLFGLAMKITISKYNSERGLFILYKNRESALRQYELFEAAIGDDTVGKNEMRLEVARHTFADPLSTYSGSTQKSDININPIFGAVEKITPKLTK